jgi:hypothetical protein
MTKYIYGIFVAVVLGTMGCKDQLDIGNPNAPTLSANVNTETGVISLAQGGVYINGFLNGDTWLGNSYFSLPMGYNELMADNVGASASNNQVTTVGQPDYIILDDGTKMTNTSPSVGILRTYNTRAATGAGNNAIHYQWLNMYALNNACNLVLSVVDEIPFRGDAASKANTIKAWCYWWKGFAYASIGTKYYAGLIVNEYGVSSNDYVLHDAILNESNTYFNLAATTLSSISSASDYSEVLVQLIPSHTQVGNGGVPTIDMWKRNINTMLARNILLNKLSPFVNNNPDATITQSSMSGVMTDTDWNAVKTLATDGIQKSDIIFTGRTTGTNDFFSATGGTVASLTATNVSTATFKVSERVIQNFKTGDKRFDNNFNTNNRYSNDYIYTTRYNTVNGGNGIEGVFVYADRDAGEHELIIAGSYEENALMLAEANIRLDDIDAGLSYIDDVRDYFGAGLTAVSGTGLTVSEALSELTKERRVALLFRGLSYYDSRRWGWTYDISKGGGSYGNTIVQGTVVNTNAIINYNFMDYWDVPANESALNPPSESSVAVENPNY